MSSEQVQVRARRDVRALERRTKRLDRDEQIRLDMRIADVDEQTDVIDKGHSESPDGECGHDGVDARLSDRPVSFGAIVHREGCAESR